VIAKLIRALFVPDPGEKWAKLDYSQQELRVLTHYAYLLKLRGATEMRQMYLDDKKTDFHMVTARISGLERKPAKDLGFGICYGEGKDKMARDLGKTLDEAIEILTKFNEAVPFITKLSEKVMERADRLGYITTLLGRHRHFDWWEPVDAYQMKRRGMPCEPRKISAAKAEWPEKRLKRAYTHKALNALIQGSSADMTKQAMLIVWKETGHIPLMQVHDELNYSVVDNVEATKIQYRMENAVECTVPILADLHLGEHWK
jgi:DNA polymerase I-like protein with 3'-5' exonuclease and polymerase domains